MRSAWLRAVLPLALGVLLAPACSHPENVATGPAGPAAAPAQTQQLTAVTPTAALDFLASDAGTGTVAGAQRGRPQLRLFSGPSQRTVQLSAPVSALATGRAGEILAAGGDHVFRVDTRQGSVTEVRAGGEVRTIAALPDGTVAAGIADGAVQVIGPDGRVSHTVKGLTAVDALAPAGSALVALDRSRSAATALTTSSDKPGATLDAGDGGTNLAGGGAGRVFATDTRGGALLVYLASPFVLRQRFPVGSSPYALAFDQHTGLVWVTLTASNEVAAYDVAQGIPREVRRHATVRQPDSIAVDGRTGMVYVGSASGDGLQQIGGR